MGIKCHFAKINVDISIYSLFLLLKVRTVLKRVLNIGFFVGGGGGKVEATQTKNLDFQRKRVDKTRETLIATLISK